MATDRPVMIMAGGTGGHVFPGLAVAEALRARHGSVVWLGTERGLEARVVPQHGIDVEWISIGGVRGKGAAAWLAAPFRIAGAVLQAFGALRRRRPAAVLGMGGFVAGPGGLAAWLARKPLLLHEQNAVPGTTNRLLAPLAARVFASFPGTFPSSDRAETIGLPVRSSITPTDAPRERLEARRAQRRRVLIIGGSQGARVLNKTVPAALARLPEALRPEVWHQAGRATIEEARQAYAAAGVDARIDAFIDDMPSAYRWADLVVARAGGSTLAELAIVGVGAILVPLASAIDDHQTANARHFTGGGAGLAIPESELNAASLASALERYLRDVDQLIALAEAARAQARPDAADRLAAACLEAAEGRR
ncbi:MAG TPA: undecaprenyldiphospho-muramoylpentapeptide beta-N-acetylglucosaminyltransferase [Gammaproteobacteria bacterium]|nr:undecaprenyldiphospho-muramoylpentapeptide beta-N-acetylglucosaminyltransferase [Gammaproteobacteria bacterium]